MTYRTFVAVATLGLLTHFAFADEAQIGAIRFGFGWSSSSAVRNGSAGSLFAAGVDTNLSFPGTNVLGSTPLTLSVDIFGGNGLTSIPVLLNYKTNPGTDSLYFKLGAGIGYTTFNGSSFDFAYTAALGLTPFQENKNLFVEARYYGSSRSEANALCLMLGYKF